MAKADLHHKQINLLLRGVDIVPVMDPAVAKVWFFDRAKVDAVLVQNPDFWRYDKATARAIAKSKHV